MWFLHLTYVTIFCVNGIWWHFKIIFHQIFTACWDSLYFLMFWFFYSPLGRNRVPWYQQREKKCFCHFHDFFKTSAFMLIFFSKTCRTLKGEISDLYFKFWKSGFTNIFDFLTSLKYQKLVKKTNSAFTSFPPNINILTD